METWQIAVAMIGAFLGSGGFGTVLTLYIQKRMEKKDLKTQMLLGLAHHALSEMCDRYIDRWENSKVGITDSEYNDLMRYMYAPYKGLGGNDTSLKRKIDFIDHSIPVIVSHPEITGIARRCSNCRHSRRSEEDKKLYCFESAKKLVGDGDRCGKWELEIYRKEISYE